MEESGFYGGWKGGIRCQNIIIMRLPGGGGGGGGRKVPREAAK